MSTSAATTAIDTTAFRSALSTFATGVAVLMTRTPEGEPMGMTISSFNSVSLKPPLVLWSIAKDAFSHDAFVGARHFAVNVLAMHQKDMSSRFARRGADKFAGLDCAEGIGGVPKLPEFAACFECESEFVYEGGDHTIIVGRVERFESHDTDPLIFYRGRFLRKGGPFPEGD